MKALILAAASAALLACASAHADVRARVSIGMVFDSRYHHDHYYPAPGYIAPSLPYGAVVVGTGPSRYWFHGGVWYQPWGPRYRVALPPVGVVVPLLPPAYVTVMLDGLPYYYANGVYYRPVPEGYAVVTPPAQAVPVQIQPAAPAPRPPAKPEPIIYPRNRQPPEQLEADRRECNRWATTQPNAQADSSVFNRAVEACMDGRGYTMDLMFDTLSLALPKMRAGKLLALAVAGRRRSPNLPDLPTVEESGGPALKGFEAGAWVGLFAPSGQPPEQLARLQRETVAALADPSLRVRMSSLGLEPQGSTAAEFAALIAAESVKWARVVRLSGVKVDR